MMDWRTEWELARIRILQGRDRSGGRRGDRAGASPEHAMRPIGYVIQQHLTRDAVPLKGYAGWAGQIPEDYVRCVLGQESGATIHARAKDPNCLGHLRHFASLVPLAQMARKPIFDLKHADGVLGSQFQLVERARVEFTALAEKILARLDAK